MIPRFLQGRWKRLVEGQKTPSQTQDKLFSQWQSDRPEWDGKPWETVMKSAPVTDYGHYRSEFENESLSELQNQKVEFIALTSATTSKNPKHIPLTTKTVESFLQYQMDLSVCLLYAAEEWNHPLSFAQMGRFSSGSSPQIKTNAVGVPIGYMSGFIAANAPEAIQKKNFPKPGTMEIERIEDRVEQIIKESREQNVSVISGVPIYIKNLFEEILNHSSHNQICEIWPELKFLVYFGLPPGIYREHIEELVGQPLFYFGSYSSSEAPFGLPMFSNDSADSANRDLYSPYINGALYSFEQDGNILSFDEIKEGEIYSILVTMPNGLLNYRIGDKVRFEKVGSSPVFQLLGRDGLAFNVCTEKFTQHQIDAAMIPFLREYGWNHYFAHPVMTPGESPHYAFYAISEDPPESLVPALDQALQAQNFHYEGYRKSGAISAPSIEWFPREVFENYVRLNVHVGQFKPKNVFETAETFEEFKTQYAKT